MTIDEMKAKKAALEGAIHELARAFEEETGACLADVELHHVNRCGDGQVLASVTVEVHL